MYMVKPTGGVLITILFMVNSSCGHNETIPRYECKTSAS